MLVSFYKTASDKFEVNKSLTLVKENVDCELKLPTNLRQPMLIVSDPEIVAQYAQLNYARIPNFGRYYYVSTPTVGYNDILTLTLDCDVLMSFKAGINQAEAILDRQESEANLYFNDNEFYALNKETLNTVKFPNSLDKTGSLIMIVQGGN